MKSEIKKVLSEGKIGSQIEVYGWVKTFRNNQFVSLNDGSTISNLQVVVDYTTLGEEVLKKITTGASIRVKGRIQESKGSGQSIELLASEIEVLGDSDPEKFPLQPKKHSLEFLRENAHLRFRTQLFGAVFRIRHHLALAIHKFFDEKGFPSVQAVPTSKNGTNVRP